jgi:hypothetical protein
MVDVPQERLHARAGVSAHEHPGAQPIGRLGQRGVKNVI